MDFQSFLRSRRSIRRFESTPVDIGILRRILEVACHAPSAHNRQPWRFALLTSEKSKNLLSDEMAVDFRRDMTKDGIPLDEIHSRLARSKERILGSPAIVILCMDVSEMDTYDDPHGKRAEAERIMAVQSVAAAGLQLQLAARSEGLDSAWTCSPLFAPDRVQKCLELPNAWEPQAMFLLGYAAEEPKNKVIKPLSEVLRIID